MAQALEVADIFRRHGEAFRQARAGRLGRIERRVMGVEFATGGRMRITGPVDARTVSALMKALAKGERRR